jgi:hypothetical protein
MQIPTVNENVKLPIIASTINHVQGLVYQVDSSLEKKKERFSECWVLSWRSDAGILCKDIVELLFPLLRAGDSCHPSRLFGNRILGKQFPGDLRAE